MVVAVTDEIAAVLAADRSELASSDRRASGRDPAYPDYGRFVLTGQPPF